MEAHTINIKGITSSWNNYSVWMVSHLIYDEKSSLNAIFFSVIRTSDTVNYFTLTIRNKKGGVWKKLTLRRSTCLVKAETQKEVNLKKNPSVRSNVILDYSLQSPHGKYPCMKSHLNVYTQMLFWTGVKMNILLRKV